MPISAASVSPQIVLKAASALGLIGAEGEPIIRLMAALCGPDERSGNVVQMIENQPSLCVRILRVANSPYYGQRRAVTTIHKAAILLGRDALRCIAAAAAIDSTMSRRLQTVMPDPSAFLAHSLATAAAAESLALHIDPALSSEAFILGIIHNIGVAVQACVDPEGTHAILEARRHGSDLPIRTLESQCSAISHEECAACILDAWQLPPRFVEAVRHHHDPRPSAERDDALAILINASATLALCSGFVYSFEPLVVARNAASALQIDVTEEEVDALVTELPDRVNALRQSLVG